ncbi:DUF3267 domain-containing protein [Coprobacillus sp. AF34-1BH]|uniref:DUF3267 domain-containing protein n=1 Tax=Faecalibacillus faecis TaxID=1982628 RepID=UPI000E5035A4|nr:DUF3267 domain-containing protein [Faecalibacillus faecis]RGT62261.1 DUF3267 domain-containing protein [Coprobacillus sp. AF18-40]RGT85927.1 DUF3267 domain-containing protein [Coprobacillus sp. AF18-15LB]RHP22488.1 DUF3267 domain-containing protein [Coprobacillus sp. AF34-1BH]RHQ88335.1 DUF3267 domain-containing protein [Coprobacillus sp. AF21-8LB]
MKLHYRGKYNLDPTTLPTCKHQPNAVKFKEVDSTKELADIANGIAIALMILLSIPVYLKYKGSLFDYFDEMMVGAMLPLLTMFPHELLHALCFKEDVYLYTDFKQGLLFVVGCETMSKQRFIFMSLLPNIVFGFIPYMISFLGIQYLTLAVLGVIAIGMGAGDYYNVFNALIQMPKGARTYLYQMNSYWYIPEK